MPGSTGPVKSSAKRIFLKMAEVAEKTEVGQSILETLNLHLKVKGIKPFNYLSIIGHLKMVKV